MKFLFTIPLSILLLAGCSNQTYKVDDFTTEELLWYKPFTKTDSVIYTSEKGEMDTIIFNAPENVSDSTRNIEQGFSKTNYLTVVYTFSKGSYHQSAMMSDGKNRYNHWFVNSYKSSAGYESLEISFIGTFFSENIKNIQKINDSTYFFDSNLADYSGMNVEKGIKSFTFNPGKGVSEFVDDRNIKWSKK